MGTYIGEIERLAIKFSEKVVARYFRAYRPRREPKLQRPSHMITPHIKDLCSACKHGCCVYRERPARENKYYGEERGGKSYYGRDNRDSSKQYGYVDKRDYDSKYDSTYDSSSRNYTRSNNNSNYDGKLQRSRPYN